MGSTLTNLSAITSIGEVTRGNVLVMIRNSIPDEMHQGIDFFPKGQGIECFLKSNHALLDQTAKGICQMNASEHCDHAFQDQNRPPGWATEQTQRLLPINPPRHL